MRTPKEIGLAVRSLRGTMSLRDFALLCDISHTTIDNIEKGFDPRTQKTVHTTVETLAKIAKATHVPLTYIIGDDNDPDGDISTDHLLGREQAPISSFKETLKKMRKAKGVTQEELAEILGVERSTVGKYESTETIPSVDVLNRIASYFDVSIDYLLGREQAPISSFKETLKKSRDEKGLSQKALADILGVSQGTIGNWESGVREPNFKTIEKLADFFDVSVDFLLGRNNEALSTPDYTSNKVSPALSETEQELIRIFRSVSVREQTKILSYAFEIVDSQNKPYKK